MESNNDLNNENDVKEVPQSLECEPNRSELNVETSEESIVSQTSSSEQLIQNKSIDKNSDENEDQSDEKGDKDSIESSRHQYSKEQLIAISKLSFARMRPKCLDNMFNNPSNGLWNPEKWMDSKSGPQIASNNKHNYNKRDGNENYGKKANNDLKDRVIEEENDIILSPQRGSFGTGCHVSATTLATNKTGGDFRNHYNDKNKSIDDSSDVSHRQNMNHRRVGTGRIVQKDRDRDRANDWMERSFERERSYEHRNDGRNEGRDSRDNRIDDYSNDRRNRRHFDRRPNFNSNRNNRFDNDNRYHNKYSKEVEDEPEWFTEGPTSKHDTIELKGFDDDSDHRKDRKQSIEDNRRDRRNSDKDSIIENQNKNFTQKESENHIKEEKNESKKSDDFDVNELFKTDDWFGNNQYQSPDNKLISSMDGISEKAVNESDSNGKSRSKRWFKESPITPMTAQFNDNLQTDQNLLKDNRAVSSASTPTIPLTGAVSHTSNAFSSESNERNIFDLLKGSNRLSMDQMNHHKLDPTKAVNLSEIEANLKQNVKNIEEKSDRSAFEKLINELGKKSVQNHNIIEPNGRTNVSKFPNSNPMSAPTLLELLEVQENKEAALEAMDNQNIRRLMQSSSNNQRNGNLISFPNPAIVPQIVNNTMFSTLAMTGQDWRNPSPSPIRPRNPSVQDMNEHTNYIFQNALNNRQMDAGVKAQQFNDGVMRTHNPNASIKGMSNSNFFTPTSVIRKMHSTENKDRDLVNKSGQSGQTFDEINTESNTSQQKFLNEQILRPTLVHNSPRAIIKSNNPMGASMAINKPVLLNPLSPQSDSMSYSASSEPSFNSLVTPQSQQHLLYQQHFQQQQQHSLQNSSQTPIKTHQRPVNHSNLNVRTLNAPLNLSQGSLAGVSARSSTPSPNANSNMQSMLQMLKQSNLRPNPNPIQMNHQINPMMAFQHLQQMPVQSQHTPTSDGRQSQYSQSRPITTANIQQFLFNKSSNLDQFKNSSFDRNLMSDSEHIQPSVATTYSQPRPLPTQLFMNSGSGHPKHTTDSRFLGQLFSNEVLNHNISDMPPVPLQNALTLDDIERP